MNLGDLIEFHPGRRGKVIGRTFEEDPWVDLQTPSGEVLGARLSELLLKKRHLPSAAATFAAGPG